MLGPAMNLMATANDDGSITLSWTAGMDANYHFVAGTAGDGYPVWGGSSAMDSHTVSADMLAAGMQYTFYVLSGYWMEQDDGTWDGMWAAAGWSNAAMATAMEAMSGN